MPLHHEKKKFNPKQTLEYFFWAVKFGLISGFQKKIPDFSTFRKVK